MLAVLFLAFVSYTYALGVLAPLYYQPGESCSGWASISSAVSDHPQTSFYLIVNPASGPGTSGSQPDQTYNECVPSLRPSSNPNTIVLGAIFTDSKSSTDVLAEIDTYSGWDSTARPTGIFFASSETSTTASSSLLGTYQTFFSHARDQGFNFLILDPGATTDSGYFPLVDLVNTFESAYSTFSTSDLIVTSSTPASKQTVILPEAPASGSYSTVISELAKAGVAAVYITDLSDNVSGIPAQWSSFVDQVAESTTSISTSSVTASDTGTSSPSPSQTSLSGETSERGSSPSPTSSSGETSETDSSPSPTSSSRKASETGSSSPSPSPTSSTSSSGEASETGSSSSQSPSSSSSSSSGEAQSNGAGAKSGKSLTTSQLGAIIGCIIGGLMILAVYLALTFCRRRRNNPSKQPTLNPFLSESTSTLLTVQRPANITELRRASFNTSALEMPSSSHENEKNPSSGITTYPTSPTLSSTRNETNFTGGATRGSLDRPPSYSAPDMYNPREA